MSGSNQFANRMEPVLGSLPLRENRTEPVKRAKE